MAPRSGEHDSTATPSHGYGTPEARAARRASRAGSTYARFIREVASAGGYTMAAAERFAVGTIATLEERLPIVDVCALEAQLPSRLDQILAFQPLIGLPTMDRKLFCTRVAQRVGVPEADAEGIVRLVFRVLRLHVSPGEIRHVEAHLSDDMKPLWSGLDR